MSNSHDFFKKFQSLFESKDSDRNDPGYKDLVDKTQDKKKAEAEKKAEADKKPVEEGKMSELDIERKEKREKAAKEAKEKKAKEAKEKKPANVKESGAEFFRRYADIVTEAEEDDVKEDMEFDKCKKCHKEPCVCGDETDIKESYDDEEDPDVAIADKEKGKDKKTQKDSEKNLPPWLKKGLEKKDKEAEDKGAKKTKKDKEAFADSKTPRRPMIK
jgi:hypothetical protein